MQATRRTNRARLLLALMSVAALAPVLGVIPDAAAEDCSRPVLFAGARGSGESQGDGLGMGKPVYAAYNAVQLALLQRKPRATVESYGVQYPAISIPDLIGNAAVGDWDAYNDSAKVGADVLYTKLRAQTVICPSQWFVLSGYSQGAHVVEATLDRLGKSTDELDGAVKARIVGVALFGSPVFSPADGTTINYRKTGKNGYENITGIYTASRDGGKPTVLSTSPWRDITRSYCLRGDDICNYDFIDLVEAGQLAAGYDRALHPHYQYVQHKYTDDAGSFLASLVRKRLGTTPPPPPIAPPTADATQLVSVAYAGGFAGPHSVSPSVSSTGRYVAFSSASPNIVPGDTNSDWDVFVRDLEAGTTRLVSTAVNGGPGDSRSEVASISADGRYVAFNSQAGNLVASDTNGTSDVFVRDLQAGTTRLASVAAGGGLANGWSGQPSISANGRHVAFMSSASNLIVGDTHQTSHVYVRDLQTGVTQLVSRATSGGAPTYGSGSPSISADGRYVAFDSLASDLVSGDTNNLSDVLVRDLQAGVTRWVSSGAPDVGSERPSVSADGRYVAFTSHSSSPVSGGKWNVFVRDLQLDTTRLVSVAADGGVANGPSADLSPPAISTDGRYVAFDSAASNLVASDSGSIPDVFVRDLQTGSTRLVSVAADGGFANGGSDRPSISGDGGYVAFGSGASNLVPGEQDLDSWDVFLHQM